MRADRLLGILLTLQARTQVSATELAEQLEVSVRTIYRDVEALSTAGVPVYCEQGRNGGVRLLPEYRAQIPALTQAEALSLAVLTSDRTHVDLGLDDALSTATAKLLASMPAEHRGQVERAGARILADPRPWRRGTEDVSALGLLQEAVLGDRRVHITYRHGRSAETKQYTLDPYGLVAKAGTWYLVADYRRKPQLFRVSRVQRARRLDEPVHLRSKVTLEQLWAELAATVERRPTAITVVVRPINPMIAGRIRRVCAAHLDTQLDTQLDTHITTRLDAMADDDLVTLIYDNIFAARGVLLGFADDIEILEPPELRDELVRAAQAVVATYS